MQTSIRLGSTTTTSTTADLLFRTSNVLKVSMHLSLSSIPITRRNKLLNKTSSLFRMHMEHAATSKSKQPRQQTSHNEYPNKTQTPTNN